MATITALIPAHNEEAGIADTIEALRRQTVQPDRIIVVADNCTDRTVEISRGLGVEVIETVGNTDKKAGALNQAFEVLLKELQDTALVLVQDADTVLSKEFFEVALSRFGDPFVGAVGGSFYPKTEPNALSVMQGNEYARYVREIARRREARANVLTGAGSVFRMKVLREVSEARLAGKLPGFGVYKQDALTEDNELTLAVKSLGYKVVSPKRCEIHTDVPASLGDLYEQRLRWRRGALEDLKSYGLNRVTAPYIGKMLWALVATGASALYLVLLTAILVSGIPFVLSVFWLSVFGIYYLDRLWTLRGRNVRSKALAAAVLPEMAYDLFQQVVMFSALLGFIRRTETRWVHRPVTTAP